MSRTATPSVGPLSSYAISSTLVRTRLRTAGWFMARRSGLGLAGALLLLALAQVIFGRASLGSWRGGVGIELLLGDRHHAAVLAHLDHLEALRRILEHPVLALELGSDALDRALDPERPVAADAMKRLFLFEHAGARRRGAEIELRPQGDHFLRARGLAQPALHAGVFRKAQLRALRIVAERAGRAGRHAGEAERAALHIDLDRAEGRARRQCDHVDGRRRGALKLAQRQPYDVTLRSNGHEAGGTRRALWVLDRAQGIGEGIGVVSFDRRHTHAAEAEPGEDRLGEV